MKMSENLQLVLSSLVFVVAITALIALPYILSNPSQGKTILEGQGYRDVSFIGVTQWHCESGELRRDMFRVTDRNGTRNKVVVCSGFMKASTVRFIND